MFLQMLLSFGLQAVILQKAQNDLVRDLLCLFHAHWSVLYTALTWATWACEKFSMYLIGKPFILETNHKSLVWIYKNLNSLLSRDMHFRLCLMRYNFHIIHFTGKALTTADTLSRVPYSLLTPVNYKTYCYWNYSIKYWPLRTDIPPNKTGRPHLVTSNEVLPKRLPSKHHNKGPVTLKSVISAMMSVFDRQQSTVFVPAIWWFCKEV